MSDEGLAVIGVTSCNQELGLHPFNVVGEKYLLAIADATKAWPLVIPSLGHCPAESILPRLDGVLFTGSPSNIEPYHFQGQPSAAGTDHDPKRDATTLPLLKAAIDAGVPVLAICRGFQEMNVVYGGTLHQKLHELDGYIEHREDKTKPVEVQYGISHEVQIEPGGLLHEAWGRSSAEVNSVHTQGVDRLGVGLRPEAFASDGLVEAFSINNAKNFALGVQWHPEWRVLDNPFYTSIFKLFSDACVRRARNRVR
jgi:putative glutamine amidotransferase